MTLLRKVILGFVSTLISISAQAGYNYINYDGIAKFDKRQCSASLIKYHQSEPSDKAIVLTSAHCIRIHQEDFPEDQRVWVRQPILFQHIGSYIVNYKVPDNWTYDVELKNYKTLNHHTVRTNRALYYTRSYTDLVLMELDETYADLKKLGFNPLTLSSSPAKTGDEISVVSGQFDHQLDCKVAAIAPVVITELTVFKNAIRYSKECEVYRGTSGSPVISKKTGEVVGINALKNNPQQKCNEKSVCEYYGNKAFYNPIKSGYATEVHNIYSCLNEKRQIDLSIAGCQLYGAGL